MLRKHSIGKEPPKAFGGIVDAILISSTPKRGASNALAKATEHINAGYQWIIDLDLKSFFDKINHDKLMSIIERKISDKVLLKLIRNYLQSMRGVKN